MILERMDDFFSARIESYEEQMMTNVVGAKEGYAALAGYLPQGVSSLLDLGCGTGLELEPIFARFPSLSVTGVDLSRDMLGRLKTKFSDRRMELVCGSYVGRSFGCEVFDAAVSFETMHHLTPEVKRGVYENVLNALRPDGVYIECDYMASDRQTQEKLFAEYATAVAGRPEASEGYYHIDIPCTPDRQLELLAEAGFGTQELLWRQGNTTIVRAYKRRGITKKL